MAQRSVVFVSYAREDVEWKRRFEVMLKPLVDTRRLELWSDELEVWSDQRVVVGEMWRPQLAEAIRRSQAALLLVSPDFLASQFIMREELPALIAEGAKLVCALLKPCRWSAVPELERVQWTHDPERALSWARARQPSASGWGSTARAESVRPCWRAPSRVMTRSAGTF